MACVPIKDSDQAGHLPSLLCAQRVAQGFFFFCFIYFFFIITLCTKIYIRAYNTIYKHILFHIQSSIIYTFLHNAIITLKTEVGKRKVLEKRRNSKNKNLRGRKKCKRRGKIKQNLLPTYLLKLMCV